MSAAKTYIDVAYKDRDLAKRLGARWDASVKRWYCPSGSTLALIYKWRKAPTPAEMAPVETGSAKARETVVAETARPAAKVVRASISRMPVRKATAPASNDLFANLELPLAS